MSGIDRHTYLPIDNLASAYQGIEVTLGTRLLSRVMRREFGGGAVELLGRLLTPALISKFQLLVSASIDVWEPRFRIRRIIPGGTVDEIRLGKMGFILEADYRPRGHLGDFTVERVVGFSLFFLKGGVKIYGV